MPRLAYYGRTGAKSNSLLVLPRQTDYGRTGAKLVLAIHPRQADYGRTGEGSSEKVEGVEKGLGPQKWGLVVPLARGRWILRQADYGRSELQPLNVAIELLSSQSMGQVL